MFDSLFNFSIEQLKALKELCKTNEYEFLQELYNADHLDMALTMFIDSMLQLNYITNEMELGEIKMLDTVMIEYYGLLLELNKMIDDVILEKEITE